MNLDRRYLTIIITFFVVVFVFIGGILLWQYVTSFHAVTFTLRPTNLAADVYKIDPSVSEDAGKKVKTVTNGQKVSLQKGTYYAVAQDKKYSSDPVGFTVADTDTSVTIEPGYSSAYLNELFKKELPAIKQAILAKYPSIATGYTLNDGSLYLDGTWYGTTIKQPGPAPDQNGDIYRTVLHKVNGVWTFAATPQIVLSAPENPTIPQKILSDLNSQVNP